MATNGADVDADSSAAHFIHVKPHDRSLLVGRANVVHERDEHGR
jgi:hypothetical protein